MADVATGAALGAAGGSVFGPVGTVLGGVAGGALEAWNTWQQKKQQDWQKKAQKITWQREDTAQQRAVRDLKAAGLSPTLAAGHGAPTSAPTNPKAPEFKQERVLNLLQMRANIASTMAEARAKIVKAGVDERTAGVLERIVDQKYNLLQNQVSTEGQRRQNLAQENRRAQYDLSRSEKFGIRTGDRMQLLTGAQMGDQFLNTVMDIIQKSQGGN